MSTQQYFLLSALVVCISGCGANSDREEKETYTRSDCIVGFDIDWETSDEMQLQDINRNLAIFITSADVRSRYPIAGMTYPPSRDRYYVQYSDDCESKYKLTESLVSELSRVNEIVRFEIYRERVEPSSKTIDIGGAAWRDGH